MSLQSKIEYSIALLRRAEPLALKMSSDGFYLAFSGGKDSQVLYHVAKMAGVKFKAHYNLTTLDPPEIVYFIKHNYPDVIIHRPELTFLQLIEKKKQLPLRFARFCCSVLKEGGGVGTCTLIGIRAAESVRRAKRNEVTNNKGVFDIDQFNRSSEQAFQCIGGKDKVIISPILKWSNADVWNFIRGNSIEYCSLYDNGWHRIGCLFCPMASTREKRREELLYPKYKAAVIKTISKVMQTGYCNNFPNATPEEVFDCWISNTSFKKYFGMLRNQTKINFNNTTDNTESSPVGEVIKIKK